MIKKSIVIDREYGSGGREVARILSEKLGMEFYDGNLLVIDADNIKFGNRPEDFSKVTDMIDAQMFGLFSDNAARQ